MYIPANNYVSEGLRINFIHSLHNDKAYNIKRLRKIDETLARNYTQTQLYGGSLKGFWNKVRNIGRRVLQAPAQIASKVYPVMKKGIDFLAKNDTAQQLLGAIPKVGPIAQEGVRQLSKLTDHVDKIIESIRNKNPSVSVKEAKDLIGDIHNGVKEITDKTNISEEEKQRIKDNADKIYNALPNVIKSEGYSSVKQAAGYLPFLDPATMKVTERTSKSGGALKPRIRFTKPKIITQNKDLFKKIGLAEYKPEVIGSVGGAIYGGKPYGSFKDDKEHWAKEKAAEDIESKIVKGPGATRYSKEEKEKSGRSMLKGGRSTLAGEMDDDEADKFIAQMRKKLSISKKK